MLLLLFVAFSCAPKAEEAPEQEPAVPAPDTVSIAFLGDLMMHGPQIPCDYSQFVSRIAAPAREADLSVANIEFTMSGPPYTGYPCFSSPDSAGVRFCSDLGLDVILLANNHILDKGMKGLERTLSVVDGICDSLGGKFTGIARSEEELASNYPLIIKNKGIRFAFVNFTYGTNIGKTGGMPRVNTMVRDSVAAAIDRAKADSADFVIALPHWGDEYHLKHNSLQQEWAEWMVDRGVSAIVGGHPHVVQDTAFIKGAPVFYSLGNVVSNQVRDNTRIGLMVILRFVKNYEDSTLSILEPELRYTWCAARGSLIPGYATIFTDEWTGRRDEWAVPSDHDLMLTTLARVRKTAEKSINNNNLQ